MKVAGRVTKNEGKVAKKVTKNSEQCTVDSGQREEGGARKASDSKKGTAKSGQKKKGKLPDIVQDGRDERGRFAGENNIGEDTRFGEGNQTACKYREEYCDMLVRYFQSSLLYPTFEEFAETIGVSSRTLLNWCEEHRRFSDSYERARGIQKYRLIQGALSKQYDPSFAKFLAINCHGMSERSTHDQNLSFEIKVPDEVDEECE